MRPQRFQRLLVLLLLSMHAIMAAGCKVTAEDIEYWKGTQKGPGKILAVMLSDRYELPLRTTAALALVEMEPRAAGGNIEAFDGITELLRGLSQLDAQTRVQIADGLVPGLEAQMRGAATPSADGQIGPPPQQIRAKDAGFLLITHASPAMRDRLVNAVVGWYVADFNGRSLSGNFSAEQVVAQLGSRAAGILVDALNERVPERALVKLAEIIGRSGDDATKTRAAARLVEVERRMESQEFLDWLKGQLRAAQPNMPPPAIDEVSSRTRERIVGEGILPAMKHLASQPAVVARLLEIAENAQAPSDHRQKALQALEGAVNRTHGARLLELALNRENPVEVRDYAFDRVGDIRDQTSIERMWPLVQNAEGQRLRWRAGELVLAIGGVAIVPELFNRFPTAEADGSAIAYEPEELEGYAQRMSQMTPPPTELVRAQLSSPDWWDRVIALRYFERKGVEADAAQMERLRNDGAQTRGQHWGTDLNTVGKVAQDAVAGLRERLANPGAAAAPAH